VQSSADAQNVSVAAADALQVSSRIDREQRDILREFKKLEDGLRRMIADYRSLEMCT
jgi:hypothetical protein